MKLLGVSGLQEMPITIPEHSRGTVLIWQNDVFHRRSRQRSPAIQTYPAPRGHDYSALPGSGVRFRPYVRMGFWRAAEPTAPAWVEGSVQAVRRPLRPFWPAVLTRIYLGKVCSCPQKY
jgi:hypothetical protein